MQKRNILILALLAAFAASIGLVMIGEDSLAIELAPPADVDSSGNGDEVASDPLDDPDPIPAVGGTQGIPVAATSSGPDRTNTTNWTAGVVRGDIRIATSVLDRLDTISVTIAELRSAIGDDGKFTPPFRKTVPVEIGIGTPTFKIHDIPFSDYPYVVSVNSPGLNGGRRTVTITSETPLYDVVLKITPGRPYTVLVRDQDRNPYPQIEVRLRPEGEPLGRKEHIGTTDGYGSAVFESLLAGDYLLVAGMRGIPLADPEIVTVQSDARVYGNKIQGQGYTLVVQRGVPVKIFIGDAGGYGIAGASVKLQATDRVKLTVIPGVSGYNGNVEFPHVTPGKWMIQVTKQNHTPWTRQITITDGQLPELLTAKLVRLR